MSTVEEQKILIELETMPFIVGPTDNGQERKQQEFDSMGAKNDRDRPNDTKSVISTLIARKTGISATSGLINFICGMIGPGCFSLAVSFKQAGLWGGLALVFIVGFLSLYSMHKIVNCSQYLAKSNGDQSLDYGEMAEAAMQNSYKWARKHGKLAKIVINACLLAFQLGVITVFMVFAVEHVIEIWEFFADSPPPFSKCVMILMYFVPQMLLNFIGHMKLLTILCLFGNVIIFAAIVLITKELMVHTWYPTWELGSVTGIEGISLAAGALIYSFEGQAMVLPMENSLKYPKDMTGATGVLSTAMNLVTVLYAFLGFFGYVTFGPAVQGSLTLNLPNSILTVSIKGLLVLKIFFGSAIQLYVIVQMLLPSLRSKISEDRKMVHRLLPYALRLGLMLISLCIALIVPNLMQIIPLVGITSGLLISLILPSFLDCMVFLPVFKKQGDMFKFYQKLIINVFLFVLGWFFLGAGLYSSIDDIINNDV
ncbi:Amino acid transporter transmembrane domain-containing protein [Caenorhabditis elegans]|uniref:Amino acid transporter transmembrane domain-containing protein n=1 Tax=Caenorhabditis elegans TaxID=6239 RepID=O62286_CAEEL|nr:Amino acid transporter transmembrane domain-containing protein [Caenorhabditis elegans]CAB10025.1 Amino acid transporter transmembrane domain-containing protein [Caenorhabditis elegans]|eukprot:NP_492453.1 SLC (SoLute Carrier) homolog [Caenorhabditis elegans]